jgi:tubulin polyglutamylase TTLL6/13
MCFEILGVDIILDSRLKPYLLEINHAPSFNIDSPIDELIKNNVLTDSFGILYKVGPKSKKLYRQKKASDMQRRIIFGKSLLTKEEKFQEIDKEIKKKDKYMLKNKGNFNLI